MKKIQNSEKNDLMQEFVEYIEMLYWEGAENDLDDATLTVEYEQFVNEMAH